MTRGLARLRLVEFNLLITTAFILDFALIQRFVQATLISNALMVEGSRDGNCILFADLLPILTKHGLEVAS